MVEYRSLEDDGNDRAYLTYTIDGSWGDRTMHVRDLAFVDHEGLLAICAFCANHDSQVTEVTFSLPTDVDFLDLVPTPEDVECTLEPGAMARIVDVRETLSAFQYPDVDAQVTITVTDSLVEWNEGTITLSVTDGEPTCEYHAEADEADPETPSVTLDIGTLTQLVVGYRSTRDLEQLGRVTVSEETRTVLERLFPREQPYLGTRF